MLTGDLSTQRDRQFEIIFSYGKFEVMVSRRELSQEKERKENKKGGMDENIKEDERK